MKASWLYSKNPLVVDKDLATVIGLNEAITLQQINYWLHVPGGKNVDGKHWIKHTVSEFLEKDFPFWSRNTVRRAIASCEKKGFLLERNLNNAGFDKSKWYSINEVKLDEVMSHAFAQNGPTSDPKWANGVAQNEQAYTRDSPENTSETTTTNNDSSPAKQDEQTIPYKEIVDYLNQKTGAKYKATTKPTQRLIKARWNEGYRLDDFKKVMDNKAFEWQNDSKMWKYMRPATLFGTKFDDYLNANDLDKSSKKPTTGGYEEILNGTSIKDIPDDQLPF
ncbi:conserved phage C-terminal domain-containing protein [Lactobacillus helveticus]|uniref:conserved phage C-terminal domain-containing protein n=1 Tax=Lactobacillus helveticus TaxID=1587 RepID=UPI001561CC83|nr:conserved phage C-terminal domain-containing protein [Lactobacillus helveticus]NRO89301.1 hypothetical protein [Lactobacillus helveticus]